MYTAFGEKDVTFLSEQGWHIINKNILSIIYKMDKCQKIIKITSIISIIVMLLSISFFISAVILVRKSGIGQSEE